MSHAHAAAAGEVLPAPAKVTTHFDPTSRFYRVAQSPAGTSTATVGGNNVTPINGTNMATGQPASKSGKGKGKTGKNKAPKGTLNLTGTTLEKVWADRLIAGEDGPWCAEATDGNSGAVIYQWAESHWSAVGSEEGKAKVATWIDANVSDKATVQNASSCWAFAESRLREKCKLPSMPMGLRVIPLENAYLHLGNDGNIVVKAPDMALGVTYAIRARVQAQVGDSYQPRSVPKDSLFGRYLESSLPDPDIRGLVQEQCAFTLLPMADQIASWWVGNGRNGKSVLMEVMQHFHKQTARTSLQSLDDPFGLESLLYASLILVDEVDQVRWCEGKFKTLVACNGVMINRKNKLALNCRVRGKWMISSNQPPMVRDKSDAVWARLCVVEWTQQIPENMRIPDLDQRLVMEEGNIVLDWLLEGAQRLVRRGRFMPEHERPNAVQKFKTSVRLENDSVEAWAVDTGACFCVGAKVRKLDVYDAYAAWCSEAGRDPIDPSPFWRSVYAAKAFKGARESDRNVRVNGKQQHVVSIARTKDEAEVIHRSQNRPLATPPSVLCENLWDNPFAMEGV